MTYPTTTADWARDKLAWVVAMCVMRRAIARAASTSKQAAA